MTRGPLSFMTTSIVFVTFSSHWLGGKLNSKNVYFYSLKGSGSLVLSVLHDVSKELEGTLFLSDCLCCCQYERL